MAILVLGLALWGVTHLMKTFAPGLRAAGAARLGETGMKAAVAVASLGAVALMVLGYRAAPYWAVWTPPGWTVHLNNLAMIGAVLLLGAGHAKGGVKHYVRHPMLWSAVVWAAAHLLVNGDIASILLFGGLGLWAGVAMWGLNRRGAWDRPGPGTRAGLIRHFAITAGAYVAIGLLHTYVGGVWPFPGGAA